MKLGKLIIRKAKDVKKKLVTSDGNKYSKLHSRLTQVYECRIFGLCIYRDENSYKETRRNILRERRKLNKN